MAAPPSLVDVDVTDSPHPPQLAQDMPRHPGWVRVEPWNALLCGGAGAGLEEDGAAVAARRLAEELQVCCTAVYTSVVYQVPLLCCVRVY